RERQRRARDVKPPAKGRRPKEGKPAVRAATWRKIPGFRLWASGFRPRTSDLGPRTSDAVMTTTVAIDRQAAIDWYRRNRVRSERIFDLIDPSAYYTRPISLRNPIVFYEGHLPAFSVIAFLRRGLGRPPIDQR